MMVSVRIHGRTVWGGTRLQTPVRVLLRTALPVRIRALLLFCYPPHGACLYNVMDVSWWRGVNVNNQNILYALGGRHGSTNACAEHRTGIAEKGFTLLSTTASTLPCTGCASQCHSTANR